MTYQQLDSEVWVGQSSIWSTTHTILGHEMGVVIDSPVIPLELAALATRTRPALLMTTHADWDHLLGPVAFPDTDLAIEQLTATRLTREFTTIADEMYAWDDAHHPLTRQLPDWSSAHVVVAPATLESPCGALTLHSTPGHTEDGIAIEIADSGVLIVGDYISPCEIPLIGPTTGCVHYLAALATIDRLINQAEWIIPGHGWPLTATQARVIAHEDREYVRALFAGDEPRLPRCAEDDSQQLAHQRNRAVAGLV